MTNAVLTPELTSRTLRMPRIDDADARRALHRLAARARFSEPEWLEAQVLLDERIVAGDLGPSISADELRREIRRQS